jgi:hypothetical protein
MSIISSIAAVCTCCFSPNVSVEDEQGLLVSPVNEERFSEEEEDSSDMEEGLSRIERHSERLIGKKRGDPSLLKRAIAYYQTERPFHPVDTSMIRASDAKSLFKEIFSKFQGVVLGENHDDSFPKIFLLNHIKFFAQKCHVKRLFTEIFWTKMQKDLDLFNKTGILSQKLDRHISKKLDFPDIHKMILMEAYTYGIQIFGVDTNEEGTRMNSFRGWPIPRLKKMNYAALQVFEEKKGEENYLGYFGGQHLNNNSNRKTVTIPSKIVDIPGMSELARIPSVFIQKKSLDCSEDSILYDVELEGRYNLSMRVNFMLQY